MPSKRFDFSLARLAATALLAATPADAQTPIKLVLKVRRPASVVLPADLPTSPAEHQKTDVDLQLKDKVTLTTGPAKSMGAAIKPVATTARALGVDTQMPLMLTEVNRGRATLMDYAKWSAVAPAQAWGLYGTKGVTGPGAHADIAIGAKSPGIPLNALPLVDALVGAL